MGAQMSGGPLPQTHKRFGYHHGSSKPNLLDGVKHRSQPQTSGDLSALAGWRASVFRGGVIESCSAMHLR